VNDKVPSSNDGARAAQLKERVTKCRKNGEEFRFAVLCEANRPNDRVMIQLGDDKSFDSIELECKPKKIALRPNTSLERSRDV
jgi:hypothetical protein